MSIRTEVGTQPTTLARQAVAASENWADQAAFIEGGTRLSFAEVLAAAQHLARSLYELGLRPGDVVSFQLPNWTEAAIINVAVSLGGWICNPIVPIYRHAELVAMLGDCRSRALFVPGTWRGVDYLDMANRVAAQVPSLEHVVTVRADGPVRYEALVDHRGGPLPAWPDVDPGEVKLVMYTSGTTGPAKGVLHSHASLPAAVERAFHAWSVGRGDAVLMPSPVTHATGYCVGLELPFSLGTTTVLMEHWDPAAAVQLIRAHDVKATMGATPFLQELLEHIDPGDPIGLQVFACGGASVPSDLIRQADKRIRGFACRVYGATEAPLVTYGRAAGDDGWIGSTTDGKINGYEVRIADGEIMVRGDGLFLGYTRSEDNRAAFSPGGWFRTGDLGILGESGTLTVTGRKKDLIIRGGENISAKEIEDVLHMHPAVAEAAVVSAPHARLGETVAAYVRTRDDECPSVSEIVAFVTAAGLAKQKCPEMVLRIDDFPRTPSGKVRKDVLRQRLRTQDTPTRTPTENREHE